jgi:hypothetical protein
VGHIMDSVKEFFEIDEWETRQLAEADNVLQTGFRGDNGEWDCLAVALEDSGFFLFYSMCPRTCPPERMPQMIEFIHRANFGLNLGNFELNVDDGEIRFKTSVRLDGESVPYKLCQHLVHHNVLVMDEYMPGIQCIVDGDFSAEAAIMIVETPAVGEA